MAEASIYPSCFPSQPPTNSYSTPNPRRSRPSNLGSTARKRVSIKREDDDIQFVSSNPVKKRRVNDALPEPTELLSTSPASVANQRQRSNSSHLRSGTGVTDFEKQKPQVTPSPGFHTHPRHHDLRDNYTQKQYVECENPDLRVSPGVPSHPHNPRFSATIPVSDHPRGCSVPFPRQKFSQNTFWTAPPTRPRSSPALSPKQLPEHITPSVLKLNPSQSLTAHAGGLAADYVVKDIISQKVPSPQPMAQPEAATEIGAPGANEQLASPCHGPAAATQEIRSQTDMKKSQGVEDFQMVVPFAASGLLSNVRPPHQDPSLDWRSDGIATGGAAPQSQIPPQCPDVSDKGLLVSPSLCVSGEPNRPGNPVNHSKQGLVVGEPAQPPSRPSAFGHQQLRDTKGPCNEGSPLSVKSPCRKCLEARLRRQAAALAAGVVPVLNHSIAQPVKSQHAFPSFIPSAWTSSVNTAPFAAQFTGPTTYGSFLHQQLASAGQSGPTSSGLYSSHGNPSMTQSMPAVSMGPPPRFPASQMANNVPQQPAISGPASSSTTAPMPARQPTPRRPQTQHNGKHIIVDIADTCLEFFPFDEVAQRHNQPVQKVRDIFDAIIQVPLLRCTTDKRRAGKLGTARVREFNQARREMQSNGSAGDGGVGKSMMHSRPQQGPRSSQRHQQTDQQQQQQQQHPSAWEISQHMGPSDVRFGLYAPFGGP